MGFFLGIFELPELFGIFDLWGFYCEIWIPKLVKKNLIWFSESFRVFLLNKKFS
jgi:hypothetical protein